MIEFWMDRPTFVTGATGLVGGWLVQSLLQNGADVVCLVRDWVPQSEVLQSDILRHVKVVRGDVRDQALLERILGEYEIDTVFHLAAQAIVSVTNRNPVSTFDTNIAGTWSLLEACRRSPQVRQVVVASSDKAYGESDSLPYHESSALRPRFPYDVSKACADLIAQSYAATFDVPVVVSRCGNFYGGRDLNWNRIIPGTIRSILRGQRPLIRSDGQFTRDYLYVEDGAAAYLLLAEHLAKHPEARGAAFNFSNEKPTAALELVRCLLDMMDCSLEPDIRNQASGEIRHQYLDATRAKEELAWMPLFSLKEGLQRTIDWYRRYFRAEASARAGLAATAS